MGLKSKLYRKQFAPFKPLIGVAIILAMYFYGLIDFDFYSQKLGFDIPHWVFYSIFGALCLYAAWKTFWGVIWILSAKENSRSKCFFGMLNNKNPQVKIENGLEEYALLASTFYEASQILIGDKESLSKLAKNPNYIPPYRLDKDGDLRGGSQFINSIEGMHHLTKKEAEYRLKVPLENSWGITGKTSALEQMDALWHGALEAAEYNLLDSKKGVLYSKTVQEFGYKTVNFKTDTNAAGFDIIRFIYIARSSFTLGYIPEESVRNALWNTAQFIAASYESWEQLGYSYLVTFLNWNLTSNYDESTYSYITERVTAINQLFSESNSPLKDTSLDILRTIIEKELADNTKQESTT
ncbi:DUF1266 domain-containing protein [Testudinibacter sp. TR-2022]|uniref:DUF1266 domain-containing protein n=1 Tax=Testudinibacter sp. TR-2022 TaxID=2585029 RepID=UPI00159BDE99|nr:DUF1266 domain-containing protein [Testudinibacter sp. TR-2022]